MDFVSELAEHLLYTILNHTVIPAQDVVVFVVLRYKRWQAKRRYVRRLKRLIREYLEDSTRLESMLK